MIQPDLIAQTSKDAIAPVPNAVPIHCRIVMTDTAQDSTRRFPPWKVAIKYEKGRLDSIQFVHAIQTIERRFHMETETSQ